MPMTIDEIKNYILIHKKPLIIGAVFGFVASRIIK